MIGKVIPVCSQFNFGFALARDIDSFDGDSVSKSITIALKKVELKPNAIAIRSLDNGVRIKNHKPGG